MPKQQKAKKGNRKKGRNKRVPDSATSRFVRNVISFEQYAKEKGIKTRK